MCLMGKCSLVAFQGHLREKSSYGELQENILSYVFAEGKVGSLLHLPKVFP